MVIAAVSVGVFVYCLFFTVLSPFLKDYEIVGKRLNGLSDNQKESVNEELARPFAERIIKPIFSKLLKSVTRLSGKKRSIYAEKLEKELRQAGIFMSASEFMALKKIILLLGFGIGVAAMFIPEVSVLIKLLILLFALILSILIPRHILSGKIKKRQIEVRQQMPDIMDLLSVSVEAGLGFDAALLRVGERSKGVLIDELMSVYREIQMGKPRKDAFKSLCDRSSVEELKTFAGAMVQAEQLGIPIKNVLTLQARQLRLKRRQAAEEKAMKAPVKMMLPLVIFIFPVIFLILLGPSVIKIIKVFGG